MSRSYRVGNIQVYDRELVETRVRNIQVKTIEPHIRTSFKARGTIQQTSKHLFDRTINRSFTDRGAIKGEYLPDLSTNFTYEYRGAVNPNFGLDGFLDHTYEYRGAIDPLGAPSLRQCVTLPDSRMEMPWLSSIDNYANSPVICDPNHWLVQRGMMFHQMNCGGNLIDANFMAAGTDESGEYHSPYIDATSTKNVTSSYSTRGLSFNPFEIEHTGINGFRAQGHNRYGSQFLTWIVHGKWNASGTAGFRGAPDIACGGSGTNYCGYSVTGTNCLTKLADVNTYLNSAAYPDYTLVMVVDYSGTVNNITRHEFHGTKLFATTLHSATKTLTGAFWVQKCQAAKNDGTDQDIYSVSSWREALTLEEITDFIENPNQILIPY